ncbi:MAG TPA: TetR/AcrR family transcriptional regulator [Chitinophaga sp.]|uniref:TetR/AcrR family transcriptional regulator n=1 Tax=Chitinophaga sp. TaxID=1869181 RepID=UPI002CFD3758|nr:TetR/AcrR family transcriptional regulator [Chitinophaga sp.]HVI47298.1 TetR/AcrR family transcriptional regulator [Chitinophaga sp.]
MARPGNPREKIMATAGKLFYEQGYNATGINQILEEAGVAKASLYSHFGSKEELGIAYLKEMSIAWFRAFFTAIGKKTIPEDRLLAIFSFLEDNMLKQEFMGCRFINMLAETGNNDMQQAIVAHKQQLRDQIHQLTVAACSQLPARDTKAIADTVYLLFEGAIVESKVYRDVWPIRSARKAVKQLAGIA